MSERLSKLMAMLQREPNDPFLLYSIGLEHKKAGALEEAVSWLDRTIAADRLYCHAYFQKGQVLESLGRLDAAREAYRAGIAAAGEKGDTHAASELQGALDMAGA
jgi:tetratricopeptide (TPR) repeat protein